MTFQSNKKVEKFKLGCRKVKWPGLFGARGSDGDKVTVVAERQTETRAPRSCCTGQWEVSTEFKQ